MSAAITAFREPDLVSKPPAAEDFCDFEARLLRYAVYWAYFENTAYRAVHTWARSFKKDSGLYRYVRGIYNPAYRLATTWQTFVWGGLLDPLAGDGKGTASALPILVGEGAAGVEDPLRAAIAYLWEVSNWQVKKDVLTLQGAIKGDVGLEVVDDVDRGRVYLRVVQPDVIAAADVDDYGHVKGYTIEEERPDPLKPTEKATYREEVSRDGDDVVYKTFRNDEPFDWYGAGDEAAGRQARGSEWRIAYTFVPMVLLQHIDVGLDWGWSEFHSLRGKVAEVDDLASKLGDQIRKAVEGAWFFTGVTGPEQVGGGAPAVQSEDTEAYRQTTSALHHPQPGREELQAFYSPDPSSQAHSLVSPLDIASVCGHISNVLEEIERERPELASDIWTASGDASGRALRVARQRSEIKARERRAPYDQALVRAHQMAIAIGGWRQYEGFEGFGLDSWQAGLLDHSIGNRPVFAKDPLDDLELEEALWRTAEQAQKAGVSLEAFLFKQGWSNEQIAEFMERIENSRETQLKREQQQLVTQALAGQERG